MELLSPAGNYEAFLGAVNAGCDAVYFGGSKFGARAYADNFSDEEIVRAIEYAHLFGVKVYLTVNTLIKEKEWSDALEYIGFFHKAGGDACIVQDLGLISIFSEMFPGLECHVSTQAFATGKYSVEFFKKLGASRVVLARELCLDEIQSIKAETGTEIEAFIHGAMCYSYSGDCLFSSCLGGRSGNRGRCAGPCRQIYTVKDGELCSPQGYYLSMKDQCTLEMIPELFKAGVDSLKIEGRMKKPEYTAFVTSVYRKYIDAYLRDPSSYRVDPADIDKLRHMYMRSSISEGYYHKNNGKDMISVDSPAYAGNDEFLMQKVRESFLDKPIKKKISGSVDLFIGSPMKLDLKIEDLEISVSVYGDDVCEAVKAPVTKDSIMKQVSKFGDTPFDLTDLKINCSDNIFVSLKALNELRRKASGALLNAVMVDYSKGKSTGRAVDLPTIKRNSFEKKPLIGVETVEQLKCALNFDNIYIAAPYPVLNSSEVRDIIRDKQNNILLSLPRVMRDRDAQAVKEYTDSQISCGVICHNIEELEFLSENDYNGHIIAGPSLYTWNKKAYDLVIGLTSAVVAPLELNSHEIDDIAGDCYIYSYGRIPLMDTANCVEKTAFSCKKKRGFTDLYDRMNTRFPVLRNCDRCYNTIFNSVPTSLHEAFIKGKIDKNNLVLSFTDEEPEEMRMTVEAFLFKKDMPKIEHTKAYYKRGVE